MIFLDSNVPMYLVGAEHPNKLKAQTVIQAFAAERFVTDAEVFQELLHRYTAIDRRKAMQDAWVALEGLVAEVYPVGFEDVDTARSLLHESRRISARDAIHVAVMRRHRISKIVSFDEGYDAVSGIERIS